MKRFDSFSPCSGYSLFCTEAAHMRTQYPIPMADEQALPYEAEMVADGLGIELGTFLFPLLFYLDLLLDKRLVRTFLSTIHLIITFRDRMHGLLLSEMGGWLLSPEQERAGTKRLANLIHSPRWSSELIEQFLWSKAMAHVNALEQEGEPIYALWDESVWEKPESQKMEDLGPVRSSKAHRLTHYKPGYYKPPRRPIFGEPFFQLPLAFVAVLASVSVERTVHCASAAPFSSWTQLRWTQP